MEAKTTGAAYQEVSHSQVDEQEGHPVLVLP